MGLLMCHIWLQYRHAYSFKNVLASIEDLLVNTDDSVNRVESQLVKLNPNVRTWLATCSFKESGTLKVVSTSPCHDENFTDGKKSYICLNCMSCLK